MITVTTCQVPSLTTRPHCYGHPQWTELALMACRLHLGCHIRSWWRHFCRRHPAFLSLPLQSPWQPVMQFDRFQRLIRNLDFRHYTFMDDATNSYRQHLLDFLSIYIYYLIFILLPCIFNINRFAIFLRQYQSIEIRRSIQIRQKFACKSWANCVCVNSKTIIMFPISVGCQNMFNKSKLIFIILPQYYILSWSLDCSFKFQYDDRVCFVFYKNYTSIMHCYWYKQVFC